MTIKCAVTGANGYLGSKITKHLNRSDFKVIELRRSDQSLTKTENNFIKFNLNNTFDEKLFKNIDVLIHCAYDFNLTRWEDIYRTNIQGSLRLIEIANKNGVKVIFISSMSAFHNCKSMYGKAKYILEKKMDKMNVVILRPGLIYGSELGGIMGSLNKIVNKYKYIPIPGDGKQIFYLSHYEDICILIQKIIEKKLYSKSPIISASRKKFFFKNILKILATKNSKNIYLIKTNEKILYYIIRLMEKLKIKISFRSDSFISMINQNPNPNFDNQKEINIFFRSFD
tara:strand:+ start:1045 stop:1896 length:852 start_codon:yes stop_codon:yes gene_type:complete